MVFGKKVAIFDCEWGRANGAEIRSLEVGRKSPECNVHRVLIRLNTVLT